MKLLSDLTSLFSSEARSLICIFRQNQKQVMERYNGMIKTVFYTESGKRRYPKSWQQTCNSVFFEVLEVYKSQNLIFCYEIDGDLYTTYKNKNNSYFIGETSIPNYRKAGKEDRLIELRKKGDPIKSGFYYSDGKPFFVSSEA